MLELIKNLDWVALFAAIAGIITALASLIAVIVGFRKSFKLKEALEEAKARETYIVCPGCKKKIPLSEIDFHLPTGQVDNNLNGKPDVLENHDL